MIGMVYNDSKLGEWTLEVTRRNNRSERTEFDEHTTRESEIDTCGKYLGGRLLGELVYHSVLLHSNEIDG